MTRMRAVLGLVLLHAGGVQAAYDANDVALGAAEKSVLKQFPAAHCAPLQWKSKAAERRCDDSKIMLGGVPGRITFYLKRDRVEAFDVRFDAKDAERMASFLKTRYGAPANETRANLAARGGALYKVEWKKGEERAVLTSQTEKRRASLTVWRGDFEEEIYRVR